MHGKGGNKEKGGGGCMLGGNGWQHEACLRLPSVPIQLFTYFWHLSQRSAGWHGPRGLP